MSQSHNVLPPHPEAAQPGLAELLEEDDAPEVLWPPGLWWWMGAVAAFYALHPGWWTALAPLRVLALAGTVAGLGVWDALAGAVAWALAERLMLGSMRQHGPCQNRGQHHHQEGQDDQRPPHQAWHRLADWDVLWFWGAPEDLLCPMPAVADPPTASQREDGAPPDHLHGVARPGPGVPRSRAGDTMCAWPDDPLGAGMLRPLVLLLHAAGSAVAVLGAVGIWTWLAGAR